MIEITDRRLFGLVLNDLDGKDKQVKVIENSGEITEGKVIGYTSGGSIVNEEILPEGVRIHSGEVSCRVKIENINQLFIEE